MVTSSYRFLCLGVLAFLGAISLFSLLTRPGPVEPPSRIRPATPAATAIPLDNPATVRRLPDERLPDLLRILKTDSRDAWRVAAIRRLGEMPDPVAGAALAEAAGADSRVIRQEAFLALINSPREDCRRFALDRLVDEQDENVIYPALRSLKDNDSEDTDNVFSSLLLNDNPVLARCLACEMPPDADRPALEALLHYIRQETDAREGRHSLEAAIAYLADRDDGRKLLRQYLETIRHDLDNHKTLLIAGAIRSPDCLALLEEISCSQSSLAGEAEDALAEIAREN